MMLIPSRFLRLTAVGAVTLSAMVVTPVAQAATMVTGHSNPGLRTARSHANSAFSYRLEDQLLATLRYLPVEFKLAVAKTPPSTTTTSTTSTTSTTTPGSTTTTTPSTTSPSTTTTTTTTTTIRSPKPAVVNMTTIQRGTFVWRFTTLPAAFRSQWAVGSNNVVLRGALMHFQSVNNLPTTGVADPTTWRYLLAAVKNHHYDPTSYSFVFVQKNLPQSLKLYLNGRVVLPTLVNTGSSVLPPSTGT